jgi:hypothetical protein
MKNLLILTGPQGSGNHLWSKIFALHPQVQGWNDLLNEYWIGHDQEPFMQYWRDPDQLKHFDWSVSDYYVTSVSTPYMDNGSPTLPNIVRFAACAMGAGVRVSIGLIGRDRNILGHQESRVRGGATFDQALEEYKKLSTFDPHFLSYELLHLYRGEYLRQLSKQLDFPIAYNDARLNDILIDDTNAKYFKSIDVGPNDELARLASRKHT